MNTFLHPTFLCFVSSFNIFHFISVTVVNNLDGLALAKFSFQASQTLSRKKKILREKKIQCIPLFDNNLLIKLCTLF